MALFRRMHSQPHTVPCGLQRPSESFGRGVRMRELKDVAFLLDSQPLNPFDCRDRL